MHFLNRHLFVADMSIYKNNSLLHYLLNINDEECIQNFSLPHNLHVCVCVYVCECSVLSNSVTPWITAHQAPLCMGFLGKNTGVGCHFLL